MGAIFLRRRARGVGPIAAQTDWHQPFGKTIAAVMIALICRRWRFMCGFQE
jgi:hypothetical protein